jgi:hypothetical protein
MMHCTFVQARQPSVDRLDTFVVRAVDSSLLGAEQRRIDSLWFWP